MVAVASNARAVLRKENELLDQLVETATKFVNTLAVAEADILDDWVDFFRGCRTVNDELIGMTDAKLAGELEKDIKRTKKLRASVTGNTVPAKILKAALDADLNATKKLLT